MLFDPLNNYITIKSSQMIIYITVKSSQMIIYDYI